MKNLDLTIGKIINVDKVDGNSPLDNWLKEIINKQVNELSIKDTCIAIRQHIAFDQIIPFALRIIEDDCLAGEQFDGELISCLFRVEKFYWTNHMAEKSALNRIAIENINQLDDDIKLEFETWQA